MPNFFSLPKFAEAELLSSHQLTQLVQTSNEAKTLYNPILQARKLLHLVSRSQYKAVSNELSQDLIPLFKNARVRDCSGRNFASITPIEYAIWAMDYHMVMIIFERLIEHGRIENIEKMLELLEQIESTGITYSLNGKFFTEKHFDFENTLIKELKITVDALNTPGDKDWEAINQQWVCGVGAAQKLLPMHVVYEYCSNEPFNPVPEFNDLPKESQQLDNWITNEKENWFGTCSSVGLHYAIFKGPWFVSGNNKLHIGTDRISIDLAAMQELYKIRTENFINLKSQLELLIVRGLGESLLSEIKGPEPLIL